MVFGHFTGCETIKILIVLNAMTSISSSESAAILTRVTTIDRPLTSEVIKALLSTEKALKKTPVSIPLESILGTWQLRFASGAKKTKRGLKLGKGYYLPGWIYAAISFEANGKIRNQLRLGALEICFTGPCRPHDKQNILVFDFTELQILLRGKVLYSRSINKYPVADFGTRPIGKLPFFVFLWASSEAIAARGRGGGLAMWVKNQQN
jgi:hypothetical protein